MIKILRTTCILFIVSLTFLFACSKKKPPEPEPPEFKWTILGYFDGNHSQDRAPDGGSYVIKDLQELEQIGSTEEVQVLVMLGSAKTDGNCKYYHIKKDSSEVLFDVGKPDMSNPATLRNFISYGVQNYPAEHYMLIINDHGGGWKGICSDTINGDGNWMSLPELSSALAGFGFDIIWFYTPSMATAEVAYQIKDRAEYMIASQFKWYPDNIMGSAEWLPYLTDNPDREVRLFAKKVTEEIYDAAQNISLQKYVHSVLIHLPKISKVATDVSNLGRNLIDSTGSYWTEVWDAWEASHIYYQCDSAFVDLREFARQIQTKPNLNSATQNAAQALEISVNAAVLAEYKFPNFSKLSGISIYLPWNQDLFDSPTYTQLDFLATDWHSFISAFIQSFSDSYAGTLHITSTPTEAKVFLNGADTGFETNAIIGGLLPGDYALKLVKTGYYQQVDPMNITISAQKTMSLHIDLIEIP
ncbi:MAG: PEGA domain-containing protein [candidate division Zixibacteria bacterium]|nr:PEGA domain-containing protein [candidate division Zixibacteria bacterium]